MEEAKTMKTPMSSSIKLDMDEKGKSIFKRDNGHRPMGFQLKGQGRIMRQENQSTVRWGNLKAPVLHFSPAFLHSLKPLHISASRSHFWPDFGPIVGCGLDFGTFISVRLGLRVGVCSFLFDFILLLDFSFFFPFVGWHLGERRAPPRLRASALLTDLPDSSAGFLFTATYGLGGPVLSTVRGVEIRLSLESICRILDIPSVGLRVYEAKA
ncbi:hypothetical protein AAG906_003615 [Vitis piasezkii]